MEIQVKFLTINLQLHVKKCNTNFRASKRGKQKMSKEEFLKVIKLKLVKT